MRLLHGSDRNGSDVHAACIVSTAALSVSDSQIAGGKRYDLATLGRRTANATFHNPHKTDQSTAITWALDVTPLVADESLSVSDFTLEFVDRLRRDVAHRIRAFEGA